MEHFTIELPRGICNFFKRRNLKRRLNKKLAEYIGRTLKSNEADAYYKIGVLKGLLEEGHVDTAALVQKLQTQLKSEFDWILFERACGVIFAYAYSAKGMLIGGTGLPR